MSESPIHNSYVRKIYNYAKKHISNESLCFLKADILECDKPTLTYNSFVPDVSYLYNNLMIIGEAKTYDDFNTEHSLKQYQAYFKELSNFAGIGYFIACVPWQITITAKNHFARLKKESGKDIKVIILTDDSSEIVLWVT